MQDQQRAALADAIEYYRVWRHCAQWGVSSMHPSTFNQQQWRRNLPFSEDEDRPAVMASLAEEDKTKKA
jgi:hypothetical protein